MKTQQFEQIQVSKIAFASKLNSYTSKAGLVLFCMGLPSREEVHGCEDLFPAQIHTKHKNQHVLNLQCLFYA